MFPFTLITIFLIMFANFANNAECADLELATTLCRGKPNGNYCYPNNSNKFIQCSNGEMFVLSCDPGYEYNCHWDRCADKDKHGNCKGPEMTLCREDHNCGANY
ncbi:hypothetical protein B4U80_14123 [Leptotrombidium deliense]|uniref:Chitin-binding type-2 domain-containing protein n=1 Tax=Leptotrombidium deliense TaxID=299467 RepID=A0A443S240_9ACAR|nr:hypothetical protein B4U80_14123 [Leptotrombidium deliense]